MPAQPQPKSNGDKKRVEMPDSMSIVIEYEYLTTHDLIFLLSDLDFVYRNVLKNHLGLANSRDIPKEQRMRITSVHTKNPMSIDIGGVPEAITGTILVILAAYKIIKARYEAKKARYETMNAKLDLASKLNEKGVAVDEVEVEEWMDKIETRLTRIERTANIDSMSVTAKGLMRIKI